MTITLVMTIINAMDVLTHRERKRRSSASVKSWSSEERNILSMLWMRASGSVSRFVSIPIT